MKNAEEEEMRRVLFLQKHHALMIQRQKIDIVRERSI
jgi:hypothetical protein